MKTKDQIANELFDDDYDFLTSSEKRRVTRRYNAQEEDESDFVKVTIGRIGVNGTKTCLLEEGATVQDLLDQSGYDFDEDKEKIIAESTGYEIDLNDDVVHNETYGIAVEIKSA